MTQASPEAAIQSPIYSMTGFARASARTGADVIWTMTLKSVNHRFLDLHMRMPAGADSLEVRLRRLLKDKVLRGHLELSLNIERGARAAVQFDRNMVAAYIAAFRQAAADHALDQPPDLNAIFRLPGVLGAESRIGEAEMKELEEDVVARMGPLLASLNEMRAQEGRALAAGLHAGMQRLERQVEEVAGLRQEVQKAYCERIGQRVASLLTGAGGGSLDPDRLLQEAAILAERSDIEEEVTRLRTHIRHFQSLLEAGGEIGKKLDFLLQELNREANTLLSKTGGVSGNGQRITEMGLAMKSEIEKAREQVQNLE